MRCTTFFGNHQWSTWRMIRTLGQYHVSDDSGRLRRELEIGSGQVRNCTRCHFTEVHSSPRGVILTEIPQAEKDRAAELAAEQSSTAAKAASTNEGEQK